jgi:hypothetical protein
MLFGDFPLSEGASDTKKSNGPHLRFVSSSWPPGGRSDRRSKRIKAGAALCNTAKPDCLY